jgi:hypothetical protein
MHLRGVLAPAHGALTAALQVRAAIAAQNPAPIFSTLARASTTLILPLFLTLLQLAPNIIH